jgi:hypothetical protein
MTERSARRPGKASEKGNAISYVTGALCVAVVTFVIAWFSLAAIYNIPVGAGSPSTSPTGTTGSSAPSNMYLTIQINPATGMPQYSPANFTVPAGTVDFTIVDYDLPIAWSGCACNVTGTVTGGESINGSATVTNVPWTNAAHTFTIPSIGENVVSPGLSTITFALDLTAGTYTWWCMAPCYTSGNSGPPMGMPGYMTGTITVA